MEKHNKSAFQRVLAFALTLIMVVGMLPMNVTALEPSDRATVTPIGGGMPVDDGNGNFTVTVTEATLDWSAATAEHGEGWWVGVGITAPGTITAEELALATYTVDGGLPESFASKSGSTNDIQLWIPVTEEFLAAGVPETDIYEFNWNGLGDNNQTVTLTVVPSESIVLNPKAPDPEPEPETVTLTVSKTGNGTVKVNGSEVGDSVTVLKDTAVPVEVTPAAGYKIASLTVGGVSKTDEEHYSESVTFADGAAIVVTFEAIAYSISAPSVTGGTVTVTGAGGNKVESAHFGDKVTVYVAPYAGYRIKSVKIGTEDKEISNPASYQEEITVQGNVNVEVAFEEIVYNISVPSVTGGTVTVTDAEQNPVSTAHHGDKITVSVTADPGYRIGVIKVGETEISNQEVITVTEDVTVEVTFVKVYTVTVQYDEHGSVKVDGLEVVTGGSITVDEGPNDIIVTAMPNEDDGYVVSSVKIDGNAQEIAADNTYKLPKVKDYSVEVAFALATYSVTIGETQYGTVETNLETVEHGGDVELTITPDAGCIVKEVLVNGVKSTNLVPDNTQNGPRFKLTIADVADDLDIKVTFESSDVISEGLTISGELVREIAGETTHTFVYRYKDADSITFETSKMGIQIKLTDGNTLGGYNQNKITVNGSIEVERIELFCNEDGCYGWRQVQTQAGGKILNYIVDDDAPVVDLKFSTDPNEKGYYGADFDVTIIANENGIGAGIQSVKYYVSEDGNTEQPIRTTLYEYSSGQILDSLEPLSAQEKSFTVDVSENNGDNVQVVVEVTDRAGRTGTYTKSVNISYTSATIAFSDTPGTISGNHGFYNVPRVATITITDDHELISTNVQLVVDAKDVEGQNVENAFTVSDWSREGNQYTATVTFSAKATYIWGALNYTNKAGVELNTVEVEEGSQTPCFFTVDTTPPEASITIEENVWSKWLEWLSFGLYKNTKYTIKVNGTDKASPIKLQYYLTDSTVCLSQEALKEKDAEFKDVPESLTIDVDLSGPMVAYLKVTDYAGNVTYVHSDGVILDGGMEEEITLYHENMETGLPYGDDGEATVPVDITVKNTISGIKKIEYWIVKDEVEGDRTELFNYSFTSDDPNVTAPSYDDLCWEWSGTINVNKAENNSGNVVVWVEVTDNAENQIIESVDLAIDITPPNATLNPLDPAKTREENGETVYVYNQSAGENVTVDLNISDEGGTGIASVEYWIVKDGKAGDITTWPTQDNEPMPTKIEVNTADNNSSNVVVHVRVTDNAGNAFENTKKLDIDMTTPEIVIELDRVRVEDTTYRKYAVTITVTERKDHLDEETVKAAINIGVMKKAEDGSADRITVENAEGDYYTIASDFNPDNKDQYIVTINFIKDGFYDFSVSDITDNAGNIGNISWTDKGKPFEGTSNQGGDKFALDNTDPTGTVIWSAEAGTEPGFSEGLVEDSTLSYYNGNVNVTFKEDTSDVAGFDYMQYYISDTMLTKTKLESTDIPWSREIPREDLGAWSLLLNPNQKVIVYFKLVDSDWREAYISTNYMILDDTPPSVDKLEPEVGSTTGIYAGDVKVNISVTDPIGKAPDGTDGPISGLNNVAVTITDLNGSAGNGVAADVQWTTKNDGIWEGWFMVDSKIFNSNNVEVKAVATDKAGNQDEKIILLAIDTTKPIVRVTYTDHGVENNGYFNGRRTAVIEVTERNFTPENISITVNDVDVKIDNWKKVGTGDQTVHRAEIPFNEDGAYTLKVVSCKDDAGQASDPVDPSSFTIDMTAPVITVNYNNNDAQNDRYFKEPRVATITIKEQNFDENKVTITQTAAQGGVAPNVAWAHNGDTHVATLTYSVDGVYTFDITATDAAGNPSAEATFNGVAGKDFVIDTTYEDMVTIGGVANGKAYGYGETPIPTVQIGDINLDEYGIKLTGIQKGKTIDLTDQVHALLNAGAQEVNGTFDIFQVVQDLDGIYTLSVYGLDKAGNEDREEVTFTVNRFGSVYVYNDYLMGLIANGGARTPKLTDDLVITEYNAVKLLEGSLVIEITCDGRPVEDPVYEATPEINDSVAVGESGWYQYRYTISKENFTSDGVYKITVSSRDAAGNTAENNNYDGMAITFRVDSTAPEITSIVGLEEAIIDAAQVTVKYTAYDTMGLKSIQVYVDGVLVDEVTDFSADLSNYSGSFTLTEKNAVQHVRIVVEDLSGNVTDTDSEYFVSAYEFHKDVTVTTNIFVQWYANKGLFWGSIIGAGVLASLIIFLIAKRKKKEER